MLRRIAKGAQNGRNRARPHRPAILAELQRNGRLTTAKLAARAHLSASPCLRRTQRLERDGVLAGYRAEVDPDKPGQCGVADVNSSFVLRTVKAFRALPVTG